MRRRMWCLLLLPWLVTPALAAISFDCRILAPLSRLYAAQTAVFAGCRHRPGRLATDARRNGILQICGTGGGAAHFRHARRPARAHGPWYRGPAGRARRRRTGSTSFAPPDERPRDHGGACCCAADARAL